MKTVTLLKLTTLLFSLMVFSTQAADYKFDIAGQHAFIQFKVKHLGFSYIIGGFNKFDGAFSYDAENPSDSKANVTIEVASLDSNHAERDKHLRGSKFLDADQYPQITFSSTEYVKGESSDSVTGTLSLRGITKEVTLDVNHVGEGKDPWGGYRSGFTGTTTLNATDYGLPPYVGEIQVEINIEGVRQ